MGNDREGDSEYTITHLDNDTNVITYHLEVDRKKGVRRGYATCVHPFPDIFPSPASWKDCGGGERGGGVSNYTRIIVDCNDQSRAFFLCGLL
jgi:hypothetical protein